MTQRTRKVFAALLLWLLAVVTASATDTVTYVYTDPQGTPLAEADASGNITATFEYTPYGTYAPQGTAKPGSIPDGPGYTGHVNDPGTNLVYMQARYYDPATGRFLTTDSIAPNGGDAFSFNRYAYADNDPTNNIDPNGRETNAAFKNLNRGVAYPSIPARTTEEKIIAGGAAILIVAPIATAAPSIITALGETSTATSTVAAANASAETTAIAAANEASVAAQASGATSGATSGLVTESGEVFTGASTNAGGPGMATNGAVKQALDGVATELRSPFHGCCGEIEAMSNAVNAGAKLEGSVVATVRAAGRQAGQLMRACSSCRAVAEKLGVKTVEPPPIPPAH